LEKAQSQNESIVRLRPKVERPKSTKNRFETEGTVESRKKEREQTES